MSMVSTFEIFYSYSRKDEGLRNELNKHLALLKRQNLITGWYDREISSGEDFEGEITEHLNKAQIILLLVSSDFIASDYCYGTEMMRALERRATTRVLTPTFCRVSYAQAGDHKGPPHIRPRPYFLPSF